MRCTNKTKWLSCLLGSVLTAGILTGCGQITYDMAYQTDSQISSFNIIGKQSSGVAEPFASGLCVVSDNVMNDEQVDMSKAEAAVLFDVNKANVLYSKNAHERLFPASLTKVMTALVALKYATPEMGLTASGVVNITESGAQLCGLKSGDTMTMDQALHTLLLYSANDVAMMIAENVGGTVEGFVQLMNAEAKAIGATNTNFMNPHGLSDENHYTTAYDLYLIFNEAMKNEYFREIVQMQKYQTTYYDQNGKAKELNFQTTNLFLKGNYTPPANITVTGGKTGTTNAAGHCLVLSSKDASGAPYISVILRSESRDVLYGEMIDLLDEIQK